jgi:ribosomal protein L11 methyltransferase
MPLYKLRIEAADIEAGRQAAELLAGPSAPEPLAVTLFELKPPTFVVEAYYDHAPSLEDVVGALDPARSKLGYPLVEPVPDANWVALSQAALPPIRAGRFVVHGAHDRARLAMRQLAIEIEAGEAFGTGHNATTVLCLEALDEVARRRQFCRVLDLGCGTGVLAIAAARVLPAARVLATDNDPVAVDIAAGNVWLNQVASRVRVIAAAGFRHPMLHKAGSFDLVLSNLLPRPLITLAPEMRGALGPGGIAILSGLLRHQVREVLGTYGAHGFRLIRRRDRAEWSALTLIRMRR